MTLALTNSTSKLFSSIRFRETFDRFLFSECSIFHLRFLRTGVATVMLFQQFSLFKYVRELYGPYGFIQRPVTDSVLSLPCVPDLSWFLHGTTTLQEMELYVLYCTMIASTIAMMFNYVPRLATVTTWALHTVFLSASYLNAYGVDFFLQSYLWLLVMMSLTTTKKMNLRSVRGPTIIWHRLMQFFLAMVYGTSGLAKAFPRVFVDTRADATQLWTGAAILRALMRPDLAQFDFQWLSHYMPLAKLVCYGTLIAEISFPLLVLFRVTRKPAVLALISMHLGIGITMGLYSFSAIEIVALTAAFLLPTSTAVTREARKGMVVAYDGDCNICRNIVGLAWQMSGRAFTMWGHRHASRRELTTLRPDKEMYLFEQGRAVAGATAFIRMFARALRLPRIASVGEWKVLHILYQAVGKRRHSLGCNSSNLFK